MEQTTSIMGYMHILLETINVQGVTQPVHAHITIGELTKVDSAAKISGSIFNQTFLLEIPTNPSRLAIIAQSGEINLGECRYDINPFVQHEAIAHTVESDLFDSNNQKKGIVKLKLTFFSSSYGKLRVRIFELDFSKTMVDQFKQAKVKVRYGMFAQSTPIRPLGKPFDQTVQLVILRPSMSLTFDIVHQQGILATYTIKNAEQSGILNVQAKAYQVSVFNNEKAVGNIKYQLNWIKK